MSYIVIEGARAQLRAPNQSLSHRAALLNAVVLWCRASEHRAAEATDNPERIIADLDNMNMWII